MVSLENLFYAVLMKCLGNDPDAVYENPPVRLAWPVDGQPDWSIDEDVLFIRVTTVGGQDVSRPLHETWEDGGRDLIRVDRQNRVMQIQLVAYGPKAMSNLYNIRTELYNGIEALKNRKIYVVPGAEQPQRNPELFQGRWWERYDLIMHFNVEAEYRSEVKTIESVDITVQSEFETEKDLNNKITIMKG